MPRKPPKAPVKTPSLLPPTKTATSDESDFCERWFQRIRRAEVIKAEWERKFEVDRSRSYYEGFQRASGDDVDRQGDKRFVHNRILASLKGKVPESYYYFPFARIQATAARADTPGQQADERAQLLQDTANAIIRERDTHFREATLLAFKEAQWAFGMVETGYSAEYTENPYAERPPLVEDEDVELTTAEKRAEREAKAASKDAAKTQETSPAEAAQTPLALADPEKIITTETFFTRYIPARQFLVSDDSHSETELQDWLGYWDWFPLEDVKRSAAYKGTDDLEASGEASEAQDEVARALAEAEDQSPQNMVKLYRIWDLRSRVRYVFAGGHDRVLLSRPFTEAPLHPLRFEIMPGKWYPNPPIFSQLGPQDDYNNAREFIRQVRKATVPRWTYDANAFKKDELEKLESDDFAMLAVENQNSQPIVPVPQPSLSGEAVRELALSAQEFTEASGSTPERRQQQVSDTATGAAIAERKAQVRDSYEQQQVAEWLGEVIYGLLRCAIDYATLPRWILINADPYSDQFVASAAEVAGLYRQITAPELIDADALLRWDVTIDVESMSPVSEAAQGQRWMQALNMMGNPAIARVLALSPEMLKRTLDLLGVRSARDQAMIGGALQKLMEIQMQMAQQAQAQEKGVSPLPGEPRPPAPGAGPAPQAMSMPPGMPS